MWLNQGWHANKKSDYESCIDNKISLNLSSLATSCQMYKNGLPIIYDMKLAKSSDEHLQAIVPNLFESQQTHLLELTLLLLIRFLSKSKSSLERNLLEGGSTSFSTKTVLLQWNTSNLISPITFETRVLDAHILSNVIKGEKQKKEH